MVSDLLRQAVGAEMLTRWLINRLCEIKLRGKKKKLVDFSWDRFKNFKYAPGNAHFFNIYIIIFLNSLTCSLKVKQTYTWHFLRQYNSMVKKDIVSLLRGTEFKSHSGTVFHNELQV